MNKSAAAGLLGYARVSTDDQDLTNQRAELHAAGYLAPIYFALASLSNFRNLIDRKNHRDAASR